VSQPRTGRAIWLALAYVAVVGIAASYLQALHVVQATDGRGLVSYFVAGLADPTLFAAITNISDSTRRGQGWPVWSVCSVVVALVVTGGANVMAGSPHDVPGWVVRLWPPVAFLMALESLLSWQRRARLPAAEGHDEPVPVEVALRVLAGRYSQRSLAAALGVPRSRVAGWRAPVAGAALNGDGAHE
jgi:hypothetical protein